MMSEAGMRVFEDYIRDRLEERRKELNMSTRQVGLMAFPFVMDVTRKTAAICKSDFCQPQALRASDLMNILEALGLGWQQVLRKALEAAEAYDERERVARIRAAEKAAKARKTTAVRQPKPAQGDPDEPVNPE